MNPPAAASEALPSLSFLKEMKREELNSVLCGFPTLVTAYGITLPVSEDNLPSEQTLASMLTALRSSRNNGGLNNAVWKLQDFLEDVELLTRALRRNVKLPEFCLRVLGVKYRSERTIKTAIDLLSFHGRSSEVRDAIMQEWADRHIDGSSPSQIHRLIVYSFPERPQRLYEDRSVERVEKCRREFAKQVLVQFCRQRYVPAAYDDLCRGQSPTPAAGIAEELPFFHVYALDRSTSRHMAFAIEHGGWKDIEVNARREKVLVGFPRVRDLVEVDIHNDELRVCAAYEWCGQAYAAALLPFLEGLSLKAFPQDYLLVKDDEDWNNRDCWNDREEREKWGNAIALGMTAMLPCHAIIGKRRDGSPLEGDSRTRDIIAQDFVTSNAQMEAQQRLIKTYIREDQPVCRITSQRDADGDDEKFWQSVAAVLRLGAISLNRLYGEYSPRVAHFVEKFLLDPAPSVQAELEDCWYDLWGHRWDVTHVAGEHFPCLRTGSLAMLPVQENTLARWKINYESIAKAIRDALTPAKAGKVWLSACGNLYQMDEDERYTYCIYFRGGEDEENAQSGVDEWKLKPANRSVLFIMEDLTDWRFQYKKDEIVFQTAKLFKYISYADGGLVCIRDMCEGHLPPASTLITVEPEEKHECWDKRAPLKDFSQVILYVYRDKTTIIVNGIRKYYHTHRLPMFRCPTLQKAAAASLNVFARIDTAIASCRTSSWKGLTLAEMGVKPNELTQLRKGFNKFFSNNNSKHHFLRKCEKQKPKRKSAKKKDAAKVEDEEQLPTSKEPRYTWEFAHVEVDLSRMMPVNPEIEDKKDRERRLSGMKPAGTRHKPSEATVSHPYYNG